MIAEHPGNIIRRAVVDGFIRQELIDRGAPEVAVGKVKRRCGLRAGLSEIEGDLALVVDEDLGLLDRPIGVRVERLADPALVVVVGVLNHRGRRAAGVLERDLREPVAVIPGVLDACAVADLRL